MGKRNGGCLKQIKKADYRRKRINELATYLGYWKIKEIIRIGGWKSKRNLKAWAGADEKSLGIRNLE